VVPAHARRGRSACPCGGRSGGYKADGCAGRDGSASGPIVSPRPCPAYAAASIAWTYHGAAAHDGPTRHSAARSNDRRSPHGTSTTHDDVDDGAAFLEILDERWWRNERRRRR